jgi:NAD-dependent dihydropyrimidine dehydrogenase PreA subunit
MKRQIIKIDEDLCNGCELCVSGCHEGALQMVDGKARLISELYCDGLGACIGDCPVGAITIEEREAEPYDEIQVIDRMLDKGEATIKAHLKHLQDHKEYDYVKQGIARLKEKGVEIDLGFLEPQKSNSDSEKIQFHGGGGCPGSMARAFASDQPQKTNEGDMPSQLQQWPVQLHLINPGAQMFQGKDLLLAADCAPFAMNNFHGKLLSGKMLAIACPKLDSGKEVYIEKLVALIDERKLNTLSVAVMEVPCCNGLLQIAQMAVAQSQRKIPIKKIVISIEGQIIKEDWI